MTKETKALKPTTCCESWMLRHGKEGETFFTDKSDRSMTALAKYYDRKIQTERIIAVTGGKLKPAAYSVTRVTILENNQP